MSPLPASNPRPPDRINNPETSATGEFAALLLGIGAAVAAVTAVLALAAGWLAPFVPYEWETTLTDGIEVESAHPAAERELRNLTTRLAEGLPADLSSELSGGSDRTGYATPRLQVHLIDDSTPNAFATLGGRIVVTSGLIGTISSENALAMVLAHEIAHVAHRDPIRTLGRGAVVNLAWALVFGSGGASAVDRVLGSAGLLTVLRFGREMERAADRAGLAMIDRHYGHVRGAGEFFETMLDRHGEPVWKSWFRTHPPTGERLAAIARRSRPASAAPRAPDHALAPLPPALSKLRAAADAAG